ncbi:hypothetical protein HGRIS_010248 [Hohenbuehelia grisea]|uniref:Uncharacterized protein n=1 Tax=Hohenbuehelia grisea TaxID=104357 RepID=A0ABR3J3R3_9AGAR
MLFPSRVRNLAVAFLLAIGVAQADPELRTIIDDSNDAIRYAGTWKTSPPAHASFTYGGNYALTTERSASATFNFTGVAVYFYAPRWPFNVSTQVALDGGPPVLVDLTDHSRSLLPNADPNASPSTITQVVWNMTDLNYGEHVLRVSVERDQAFSVVDAIMYTPQQSTGVYTSAISFVTATPGPETSSSKQPPALAIALGTVSSFLGLVLLLIGILAYRRYRRHQEAKRVAEWGESRQVPNNEVVSVRS